MAVELVTIVHPNGQKGVVAETYQPLVDGDLKRAPSQRSRDAQNAADMPSLPGHTEQDPTVQPMSASADTDPSTDPSTGSSTPQE